jgi:hypothetical protein
VKVLLNECRLCAGFTYTADVLSRLAVPYQANGEPLPFEDDGWGFPAGFVLRE